MAVTWGLRMRPYCLFQDYKSSCSLVDCRHHWERSIIPCKLSMIQVQLESLHQVCMYMWIYMYCWSCDLQTPDHVTVLGILYCTVYSAFICHATSNKACLAVLYVLVVCSWYTHWNTLAWLNDRRKRLLCMCLIWICNYMCTEHFSGDVSSLHTSLWTLPFKRCIFFSSIKVL